MMLSYIPKEKCVRTYVLHRVCVLLINTSMFGVHVVCRYIRSLYAEIVVFFLFWVKFKEQHC